MMEWLLSTAHVLLDTPVCLTYDMSVKDARYCANCSQFSQALSFIKPR
jgi:hypothetical protein